MGIKRVWTYAGTFQTLSIAGVISNQYIVELVEKYITLRAVSDKTLPQKSWPITTLATMGQRRHNVWVVACAGARVYRTATKYMRIIFL